MLLWRWLRRMSTALLLLFALAAASVVATVVPQEPVIASTVREWRTGVAGPGRAAARVLDALGMFDVFGSWWFMTLTVGLFVSLTGCLIPRYRAFLRVARRPPARGRNLSRLTNSTSITTRLPPDRAREAAERALRSRRYRFRVLETVGEHTQVAAERGHLREGGSLIFHTSFYLLLLGAVIGQVFGFTGQIAVVEGGSFADTRIAYDFARAGRAFGLDAHRGFVASLDDFEVSYYPDLTPREFVSTVTVSEQGQTVRRDEIRVNEPLTHDGMSIYQMAFGFAPRLIVRSGDTVLIDEPVPLQQGTAPMPTNLWTGTAKVKFDDPERQIALDLVLATDASLDKDGSPVLGRSPEPVNPVLVADLYFGDLGLQRPVPAAQFDRAGGPVQTAMLRPGTTTELARGSLTVEFSDLAYWSGLQVSHQPGRWLLLVAAVLLLVGLVPSLYSYRRRVWVEIIPEDDGSRLTLAGVALQRKDTFADEFAGLAAALRTATGGTASDSASRRVGEHPVPAPQDAPAAGGDHERARI